MYLTVGATMSDFGLPWDLLAEINFGLKLFFDQLLGEKKWVPFFAPKLGLLEAILKTIITNA